MCSELSIGQRKRREPQPQTLCNKVPLRLPEGVLSVGKMHLTASGHKDGLGIEQPLPLCRLHKGGLGKVYSKHRVHCTHDPGRVLEG